MRIKSIYVGLLASLAAVTMAATPAVAQQQKPNGESFRMRPDDDGIAKPDRPFKQEQEERSDET